MKNWTTRFAVAFVTLSLATSCYKSVFGVYGKGATVSETRTVSGFDKIDLSIDADVVYVQDSVYSVVVEAQSNVLNVLETDVVGTTLEIEFRRSVRHHDKITIEIHCPDIYGMKISGSGKITAESAITTTSLELKISGSGTIKVPFLYAGTLTSSISGSGDIKVEGGTVTKENYSISGSGSILSLDVVASEADSKISGSGDIYQQVTDELNVKISGSGNVSYKGQPAVNVDISGSGNLIHL